MQEKKKTKKAPVAPVNRPGTPEERQQALNTVLQNIEKEYGKGAIMRLGQDIDVSVTPIPTGSLSLDAALGIGGIPKGRIVEIYGMESSGKTTLALHVAASVQKSGGTVAYIDVEHALDPAYAGALGVDLDGLLISQPDTGEQAMDICECLVQSAAVDLVVIDSVAALTPKSEFEDDIGDLKVGALARLMSQSLRRLTGKLAHNDCTVIFINQMRQKIGNFYGAPETTSGGLALKYYASVRLEVKAKEKLIDKDSGRLYGTKTTVSVKKNKVAPPFREAEFEILYGTGINHSGEIVDLAEQLELIDRAGAWYTVFNARIQGREGVIAYLAEHPDIRDELEKQVREKAIKSRRTEGKDNASA